MPIEEYLNFKFQPESFKEKATDLLTNDTLNLLGKQIDMLESLQNTEFEDYTINPTDYEEIFLTFIRLYNNNQLYNGELKSKDLRNLTYVLNIEYDQNFSIFKKHKTLKAFLKLINNRWRNSYLIGLFRTYMSVWENKEINSINILSEFILEKVRNYDGYRNDINVIKNNLEYYEYPNGNTDLAKYFVHNHKHLNSVTNFLSLKDSWITYPYFEKFTLTYLEIELNEGKIILDDYIEICQLQSSWIPKTRLNILVISMIIFKNQTSKIEFQNKIKNAALQLVGDPAIESNWSINGDENQIATAKIARKILNKWITRQFINVFFETCIDDERRKAFWLQYSDSISKFRVFGPKSVYELLSKDERISKYVKHRFTIVSSNQTISAFMFSIDNYKFIEFSIQGYAFYAFKLSNNEAPNFEDKNVNSVNDFRDGKMPFLVNIVGDRLFDLKEEGRLSHKDGKLEWEKVFKVVLNNILNL